MDAIDFTGNTTPKVGALAIFRYQNGVAHVALVTGVHEKGFTIIQGPIQRCNHPVDFVPWNDKALVGFWERAATSTVALLD